jgi:hypothetical protein
VFDLKRRDRERERSSHHPYTLTLICLLVMWWSMFVISNCFFSIEFISGDRQTSNNHVPTSVLSPTTINTNPTTPTLPTTSISSPLLKNDYIDDCPQLDLNLNFHHHNHLAQQRLSLDQNDDDDDDDDDDTNNQNVDGNSEISNR